MEEGSKLNFVSLLKLVYYENQLPFALLSKAAKKLPEWRGLLFTCVSP